MVSCGDNSNGNSSQPVNTTETTDKTAPSLEDDPDYKEGYAIGKQSYDTRVNSVNVAWKLCGKPGTPNKAWEEGWRAGFNGF